MVYKELIPFDKIEKIECVKANGATESISSVYKRTGADRVLNAPIFEFGSGEIKSRFVCDGHVYGTKQPNVFGFSFVPYPVWNWNNGVKAANYCAPYSYAVIDGKIRDGLNDHAKRGRTAIGVTADKKMAIYVVSDYDCHTCTSEVLCKRMIAMGCTHAINLDGGGSSQFYGGGTRYSSGRNVAGYICIWLKKEKVVFDLYKVLPASLNIRKTPNVLGKKLGVYHCGDIIASLGASGEWTKTDRGWVATKYLVKTTQPDGVPYRVTAKTLNVRAAAALNADVVGTLNRDDIVYVLSENGNWLRIGTARYVHKNYVTRVI